jgi:hypothetical protein
MNTRASNHAITAILIAAAAAFLLREGVTISAQTPLISERDVWETPWVYETKGTQKTALKALGPLHTVGTQAGPIPIRLDDGTTGALRVAGGPCEPQDHCSGPNIDSFWIDTAGSSGREIQRLHFFAAYGAFQIVPVDLVEGPGDELLILHMSEHAAPPIGYDIKIWAIDQARPRELANSEHVAGWLPVRGSHRAVPCVRWKMTFSVDPATPKPRPLDVRIDVGAMNDCPIEEKTGIAVDELQPRESLRFNVATGKFVFPATRLPSKQ